MALASGAGTALAEPRVLIKPAPGRKRTVSQVLVLLWLILAGVPLFAGLEYYITPFQDRAYSELHDIWKPTGRVGHGLGVIGTLMMTVGVGTYTIRKRVKAFARLGNLKHWLTFHIFLCTLGPFLVLLHTSFKFGGVVSLAVWSMFLVVLSGVFGRYVYARIPKTINGQFLSLRTLEARKADVVEMLTTKFGLKAADIQQMLSLAQGSRPKGILHSLVVAFRYDLTKRSQRANVRRFLTRAHVPPRFRATAIGLLEDQIAVQQQVALLIPLQRAFGYWHVMHLPLSIVMFMITAVHIGVAITFGYGWPF